MLKNFENIEYFKPSEFDDPARISRVLLLRLDAARNLAGVPFKINSSYRDGDSRAHGDGDAVDIACDASVNRFLIVKACLEVGFTRIGVYNKHIHVDVSMSRPQKVMWWGESH